MNIKGIEKNLKSSLKSKTRITLSLVVGFMITGSILANDIDWHGKANGHGNPINMNIPDKKEIEGINIGLEGIVEGYWTGTTSALILNKNHTLTGDIKIVNTVTADKIDNNDALYVDNNSKVSINGNHISLFALGGKEKNNGSTAITVGNLGNELELTGQKVQLIGNIDIRFLSSAKINLNSKDSFWYGNSITRFGILDLTLGNGAEWIYNKKSEISEITLNDGIINLQDEAIKQKYKNTIIENGREKFVLEDYRNTEPHQKVTIKNLKGTGGIFKVDFDWTSNQGNKNETDKSDYIYITKVDESAKDSLQTISFDYNKANLDKMNIGDKLYFANVKEGETKFTTIYGDQWIDISPNKVYDYTHFVGKDENEKNEKDWYIGLSGKSIGKNKNFEMAKGTMYASYFLGTELDTLSKRMGELSYLENNNEGMWVRYRHDRTEWEDTFKTDNNMVQLGYTDTPSD